MNGINTMIDEIMPQIDPDDDNSEHDDAILALAYMAKRGVLDRMEEYNWSMDTSIVVPTIDRGRITLAYAFSQTIGRLHMLADQLDLSELVNEILERGPAYYEVESQIPKEALNNI